MMLIKRRANIAPLGNGKALQLELLRMLPGMLQLAEVVLRPGPLQS